MTEPRGPLAGARKIPLAVLLAGIAAAGAALLLRTPPPERVILIVIDTLRRDHLSCYGAEQPTPHIDALAARGQLFTNVFASFHQTSMSMASLFTGRTPSLETEDPRFPVAWNGSTWCGLSRYAVAGGDELCIPAAVPTLAENMQEAGYWTIGIASNHFLYEPSGFSRGFDDWVEVGEQSPGVGPFARFNPPDAPASRYWTLVNRAAAQALNRRPAGRFFLYVHYMDVHDYGGAVEAYGNAVAVVDDAVGLLLENLERAKLLEGAVVILTSDHGERLGERHALPGRSGHRGDPSFQELLRLPLIVAPATGRDPSDLLRGEDLFYLILGIAGLRPEREPLLEPDELLIGERRFRTYLSGRWKSSLRREDGKLHLFDLDADPGERRNVADAHPEVAEAHRRRIEELSRRLRVPHALAGELSPLDLQRLRALGYLEE